MACDEDSNLTLSPVLDVVNAYRIKMVQIYKNKELQDNLKSGNIFVEDFGMDDI